MTKLEKNIISSINNKQGVGDIKFRKNMFFIELKGVLQNFAVIQDDHLFVRIDYNCKGIAKKVLKNIDQFNYTICLSTDLISKVNIGISDVEIETMLVDTFYYYDLYFVKLNLDFHRLIQNYVDYFDIESKFEELIENNNFWARLHNHKIVDVGWYSINMVKDWDKSEAELFDKDSWQFNYRTNKRNNLIDDLLTDD